MLVRGEKPDSVGMLADFVLLKNLLRDVSEPMDHVFLNDLPPLNELNPTAENMAWYIREKMREGLKLENPVEVTEVTVRETDIQSATYRP